MLSDFSWILFAILAPALWAGVNHVDKFLIDKYAKERGIGALAIFSSVIGLPVVILIAIFNRSIFSIPELDILILILVGTINTLGILPYFYALEDGEASTVAPQLLMVPAFTGLFGWILLNETLSSSQVVGIILVVISAMLISAEILDASFFRIKWKIFLLMLFSSILISLGSVLFKFTTDKADFWTGIFWLHIGYLLIGCILYNFVRSYRKSFLNMISKNTSRIIVFNGTNETLTLIGNLIFTYTTLLVPVAIVQSVAEGIQPIFIFVYGIILTKFIPSATKEDLSRRSIIQKLVSIFLMIFGVLLLNL